VAPTCLIYFERDGVRILLIHNYYQQRGGEDAVVANERTLLEQAGHVVDLYSAHNQLISSITAKLKAFSQAAYNKEARRLVAVRLAEDRPDVVHVHNTFPLLSPSLYDACGEMGVPVVQTLHNYRIFCAGATLFRNGGICELCINSNPYRAVVHRCYRGSWLASISAANVIAYHKRRRTWSTKVTRFIALSTFACKKFTDAGLPSERIVVKPNFVIDPGEPTSDSRDGILFVGRLSREKGASDLLRALSGSDIPVRILGDGPERAALEAQASANVTFEGQVGADRVRQAMRSAALLVVPSLWYEAMPLTAIEAFANGLPVVASRLGALVEIVDDNVTGRLVPPANPSALKAAIIDLLNEPDRLKAMGLAARHRYERDYSPARNIGQLLSIYADAISEKKLELSAR
jgi:glycosyltransferase involved in cell wall biosynthesis